MSAAGRGMVNMFLMVRSTPSKRAPHTICPYQGRSTSSPRALASRSPSMPLA